MNIVFFSHPAFLGSQSMPRFTRMLASGMKQRGHHVEIWYPEPKTYRVPVPIPIKKWLGYVDQYILFPIEVRSRLKRCSSETIFVFTDHALGPWVPLVADRPHVIHCHDFLAQLSALGKISENTTSWTGCQYQAFIRRGYLKGKNFISVSQNTQKDLHEFLQIPPACSKVVYNGLNGAFGPHEPFEARVIVGKEIARDLTKGYILHVGGNDWYKNRRGVLEIYTAWRNNSQSKLPLLLIGNKPSSELLELHAQSPYKSDMHWLCNVPDELVRSAYSGASVFLFPSLAEGFGWPIAEAMASGCPVITTSEPPMTEVSGDAGIYIPRRPYQKENAKQWAVDAAKVLDEVLSLLNKEREKTVEAGIANAQRFNTDHSISQIEKIYLDILKSQRV